MKKLLNLSIIICLIACSSSQKEIRPWQHINDPKISELAENFKEPPVEYSMTFYWGWDGKITEEVIARDLDAFKERNVRIVTLESGYDMGYPYLSEGWLEMVKKTVELARERDMKVWIVDEGKYPSGFAGGKFSSDAPELRMKALVVDKSIELSSGDSVSLALSDSIVSAVAMNLTDSTNQLLDVSANKLKWKAPEGSWKVLLVKYDFRSSPTRAVNNPTKGKDTSNSLCDYLDSMATKKFIEFTHEQHKKYVGEEFGKTVLGFRGDEPDYSIRGIPWTPAVFEKFKEVKGYDIQPYVASFFMPKLTDEQKRIKADYWDVWSNMFAQNFFKVQGDWCAKNNLEYLVHLNKEDNLMWMAEGEGDFFKDMQYVQMPGVDAIWNQIWPGKLNDFPKYASSASHVYGKPRAFTESFAAYRTEPDVKQAKWVLDHQFARGINMVEVMFIPASTSGELGLKGWTATEEFSGIAKYVNRISYVLSQGRPAAEIAVYFPTTSLWLENEKSNESVLSIMKQLLENQRDFDLVGESALASQMTLQNDKFINASGQSYSTVIIPEISAISKAALERLRSFQASGGKVICLGESSPMVVEKTFLNAKEKTDFDWAIKELSGEINTDILNALPEPDIKLNESSTSIKYTHRHLPDGEMYFLFNESEEDLDIMAKIKGSGYLQEWDALKGEIRLLDEEKHDEDIAELNITLKPYETKLILIGSRPKN